MKIDQTKTQVHLLYSYRGTTCYNQELHDCFQLEDEYAFVLELPWADYTVRLPWDVSRPLDVGDVVSVVFERTHNTTPRLNYRPVDWYVYSKQQPLT